MNDAAQSRYDRKLADKAMETCRYLRGDLKKAQLALCPRFEKCGDDEGEGCTCFPGDGPYANAIPKNVEAERLRTDNERFRAALNDIAQDDPSGKWGRWAREALTGGSSETAA